MHPGDVGGYPDGARRARRWRRASSRGRAAATGAWTRRPAAPDRRARRRAVRSRPGRGRRRRPTSVAPARRCRHPRRRRWRRSGPVSSPPPRRPPRATGRPWSRSGTGACGGWSRSPPRCGAGSGRPARPPRSARSPRRAGAPGTTCAGDCPGMYQMVHSIGREEAAMGQQVIERTVTTGADPSAVYALLADGSTWPEWSPLGSFTLVEPGDDTPEGLGAVRLFTTGRHHEPRARGGTQGRRGLRLRARGRPGPPGLQGRRHLDTHRERGHVHQLALHLPGQGARQRMDLPAPAGQVHRRDRRRAGRGRRPGASGRAMRCSA